MNVHLELFDISLQNKDNHRLKGINLSIKSGEKIAILGKSGSGKTSLLKVANGTLKPTKGLVKYNGTDINQISRKQKSHIATLWQDLRLVEELSVNQNINIGILGQKNFFWSLANLIAAIEENACIDCLHAAQLNKNVIHKNVKELSSGQRTRVAIARLLRQKSKIFLADEPFTALDPHQSLNILKILLNEVECNSFIIPSTCVMTLHQPQFIKYFSRIIGIKEGKIFFDLESHEISNQVIKALYK